MMTPLSRLLEIGAAGQNLGRRHPAEFGSTFSLGPTDVERGAYAYLTVRF